MIAPSILRVIWIKQPQQGDRQKKARDNKKQAPMKLTTNVEKDQLDRNEKKPFDSTPFVEAMVEREESSLATHRSDQNTGLSNNQVDYDDTPRSVSQHISNNVRSPFDTPEQRKQATEHTNSSKYSQDTRLTASDTLSTDSLKDDNSNKTNHSQHSDMDETSETPLMKKANQRIFREESRSVVIKCNQRYSS